MGKFTDKFITNLKPEVKQYVRRETEGFAIRVLPSGFRAWLFIYTIAGNRRQMNLGDYPDVTLAMARERAADARKELKAGKDPQEIGFEWHKNPERDKQKAAKAKEDEKKNPTVKTLVDDYIEKYAKKHKTSWKEDQRILYKDVVPVWGDRKAKDIKRRDVLNLLENNMEGRGNGIIERTFKIIRRMFRFAVKQEIITATPCYAFERGDELPRSASRERNLTEEEVKAFFAGIDNTAISEEIRKILKLILITGQRPGEVTAMHASEISGRWWEFTPKETKITKEIPRKQRMYLTDTALALIGDTKDKGYIFPSVRTKEDDDGNVIDNCITQRAVGCAVRRNLLAHVVKHKPATWKKALSTDKRKSKRSLFVIPDEKKLNIAKFTPHDLRRTCATLISEIGYPDEVVDAILAHLKKGEIRTYNKNKYDKEKQAAMLAWERKINNILSGKESNVIPITAGKKTATGV